MKKGFLQISTLGLSLLLLSCGGSGDNTSSSTDYDLNVSGTVTQIEQLPPQDLSQDEITALKFMWNEEKMAKDLYYSLYEKYSNLKVSQTFYNIAERSEEVHQYVVELLLDKYQISIDDQPYDPERDFEKDYPRGVFSDPEVQTLYNDLMDQGSQSIVDALKVGCIVEVVDVEDLNEEISRTDNEDIKIAFEFLRQGSYNHYWAFDNALKSIGIEEGCCSLGDRFCKTPEEFPSNNNARYGNR